MTVKIDEWIRALREALDASSYYDLLRVTPDASEDVIRTSYYKLAARLHPDRFGDTLSPELRADLVTVYSRVVEAYRVLASGSRRKQYDRMLTEGKRRWTNEEERAPQRRDSGELGRLPASAQRFVKLGQQALEQSDCKAAVMHLKLALSVAPESELIKALLARAEEKTTENG